MKMIERLRFLVISVGSLCSIGFSQDPNNDPNWDWRASTTYTVYPQLPYGAPVYTTSPFYQGGIGEAVIDNDPADGWTLVIRDFGTPTRGQAIPHFILYNKHQGLLRIFVFINTPNTFSFGSIELFFGSTNKTAALTFLESRAWAVDKIDSVKDNRSGAVTPAADNYWSFADFPMAYDPNTESVQNSRFHFRVWGVQDNSISLGAVGTLSQTFGTNQPANIPAPAPFSEGGTFDALGKHAQGTYDSWNKWREMIGKVTAGIDSNSSHISVRNLWNNLKTLKDSWLVSNLGVIGVGAGLIDFFFGGGRTNNQERPAPMNFLMNFTLSGSMTTQHLISPGVTLPVPGAIHTEQSVPVDLLYTQPLGILNLRYTPIIQAKGYWQETGPNTSTYFRSYRIKNDLIFDLNPSAELSVQSLEAAIVYHLPEGGWEDFFLGWADQGTIQLESANNGKYAFSTPYVPVEQLKYQFVVNTVPGTDVTIKVKAILQRQNPPPGTQPVVFVATYEPTFEDSGDGGPWYPGLTVPFDYPTITEALSHVAFGKTVRVLAGSHNVGSNLTVPSGITLRMEPGATVAFSGLYELILNGLLIVEGTPSNRATFGPAGSNTWKGIRFEGSGSNGSKIEHCNINYALSPIVANNVSNLTVSNVTIANSSFQNYPHDAAMAFYGSSPTISNCDIWGQPASKNGVRFSQGSYGSMSNSSIDFLGDGNGIIVEGSSSPTISNNTIHGCKYNGILVPYSGGFPLIYDNTIDANINQAYHGVRIDNSQAEVKGNIVSGHNAGFWIDNQSYVRTPYSGDGLNQIYGNVYGIHLEDESDMEFGYVDPWSPSYHYGSCNQLYNNSSYNVHMEGFSYLWAHGNYWYPTPPSGIYSGGSGIEYDCFLQYYWDCESFILCGESPMSAQSQNPDDNNRILADAHAARMRREYSASNALFQEILNGEATDDQVRMAVRGLYKNSLDSKDASLIDAISNKASMTPGAGMVATWYVLKDHAASARYNDAAILARKIAETFPDSETEKQALLFLSFLGGYDNSQRSVSQSAITELKSKYSESIDKGILAAMTDESLQGSDLKAGDTVAVSTFEAEAYPNPFNPTTTINFTIPEDGLVTLRIYDVLGRVITTLVNENRQAGPHSVHWDATRVPSGVYFSRLEALGRSIVNRLVLVR